MPAAHSIPAAIQNLTMFAPFPRSDAGATYDDRSAAIQTNFCNGRPYGSIRREILRKCRREKWYDVRRRNRAESLNCDAGRQEQI
jgi:hypothetical protein